jgi:hypothetical protein
MLRNDSCRLNRELQSPQPGEELASMDSIKTLALPVAAYGLLVRIAAAL